jgi:NADH-quinone oxidoreductase subunit C
MATTDIRALREQMQRDLPGALIEPEPDTDAEAVAAKPGELRILPEYLLEAALYLRDSHGYSFLSDIAVVDYLTDDVFEIVYRFYRIEGGDGLVLKVRVPRDNPTVPALTTRWPGADFHEREAFDLFGIQFTGHPHLRRIYMWDEFEGFPMRKDFPKQGDKYIGADE